jgi:hypothetical protein
MWKLFCHFAVTIFWMQAAVHGAVVILDDFEVDEGHFADPPSFSGSTGGILAPTSTADRDTTEASTGIASQRLFIDDDPNNFISGDPWRVRHLSGRGNIAANVPLSGGGFVGYFAKTLTPNLQASLMIDDSPTALERARYQPMINDGLWHLYKWILSDEADWEPFALADTNGVIDNAAGTVTLDSVYFVPIFDFNTTDQDATIFMDDVAYNAEGLIPDIIPEPGSFALLATGLLAVARRRRT